MTNNEVSDLILSELNGRFEISNAHGVDLKRCLIIPIKQKYISAVDASRSFYLWTVLEETENGDGYKIVYDDDEGTFGLGMKSNTDELIYLGNYGSFIETLKAM